MTKALADGLIELDTDKGQKLGFTSDKFVGYLWKEGKWVYISFIISKQENQGNLSTLFKRINEQGYGIKVPTPFATMKAILKNHNFTETREWFPESNDWCEVWKREA